jgi:hypothetical protein
MARTSKAALMMAATCMFSCAALQGAQREFDDIVRAVADELGARPVRIPFLGVANFLTSVAHPAGVKHVDVAFFENLASGRDAARDIESAIRSSAGVGWSPFLQVHDRAESVIVYMASDGNACKLLIATLEQTEATVVEVKLRPEAVQVWLNHPEATAHRHGRREAF